MSIRDRLDRVLKCLPSDFEPYGLRDREGGPSGNEPTGDCSSGCAWYVPLDGRLGMDWGVCTNPQSPRVGLLTFEHQGCPQFFYDEEAIRCSHCGIPQEEAVEVRGEKPFVRGHCEECRARNK